MDGLVRIENRRLW